MKWIHSETSEDVRILPTFDAIGLKEDLLRGVYAYGYERPSWVQQRAILPIIKGRDAIVQSPRGTGKTLAFALGALQTVDPSEREPQVLILSPSRALAQQTQKHCLALGDYLNIQVHCCIGGKRVSDDIRVLEAGAHIVSGTPSRVFHMIQQRHFSTRCIKMLVLDEADEMLGHRFKEQVYDCYRYLPPSTQVILVSASMPREFLEMTHKFMNDPFRVLHGARPEELVPGERREFYVPVERERWKFDTLCDLYDTLTITQSLVLCNSHQKVDWLTQKMRDANFTVVASHGGSNSEQDAVLQEFKSRRCRVLITTGLPRGVEIHAGLLICYDVPRNRETYSMQISMGTRPGGKNVAVAFVTTDELDVLDPLRVRMEEMPMNLVELI